MANTKRKIVATTYTYRKDASGNAVRVGQSSKKIDKTFGQLKRELVEQCQGKNGKAVKFDRTQKVRISLRPRINHLYQENKDGTYSRTYFKYEKNK